MRRVCVRRGGKIFFLGYYFFNVMFGGKNMKGVIVEDEFRVVERG